MNLHRASRLLTSALILAAPATSLAQQWIELGEGSGTPPGLIRAELVDQTVDPTGRFERRASIAGNSEGLPTILFTSEGSDNRDYVWSLAWDGSAWAAPEGTTNGRVFGGQGYDIVNVPPLSGSGTGLAAAFVSTRPQFAEQDAYAAVHSTIGGWMGLGTSLEDRGISQASTFQDWVQDMAVALGPDGLPDVAWSQGPVSRRSIFVRSFEGGVWAGLDGSDTTPIATGTTTMNFIHPAMIFRAARPVVAYTRYANQLSDSVRLQIFNVTAGEWQELNGSNTTGLGEGRRPQLAVKPGRTNFYIAWESRFTGALKVMEHTGSAWVDLGNPLEPWGLATMAPFDDLSPTNPDPAVPNVAIAADQGNSIVVAFRAESPAGSGKHHIFASWRDRTAGQWVALGNPETDTTGLSGLDYTGAGAHGHYNPSVFVTAENRPVVCWTFDGDEAAGSTVLVRRFENSLPGFTPSVDLAVQRLTGELDGNPVLDDVLDWNQDETLDAADVRRLTP